MNFVATPARLSTAASTFDADFKARLHWSADTDAAIEQRVADILADVQQRGDAAVLEYTQRFDGLAAESMAALELTQAELKAAFDTIPAAQRDALQAAAARVRSYHEAQRRASGESWSYRDEDGTLLGQKVTPLDRVGIYVPGGKAAYPSSVLMNAIPAHVAGVGEIIMVVPTPKGEKNALVLAAAYVAGVTRAFDTPPRLAPGIHPSAVIDTTAEIGPGASIGPFVVIGENVRIGPGARLFSHVVIAEDEVIGAGALITEGKVIPDNSLVIGAPGKVTRTLDDAAIEGLRRSADGYVRNARRFAAGLFDVTARPNHFDPA